MSSIDKADKIDEFVSKLFIFFFSNVVLLMYIVFSFLSFYYAQSINKIAGLIIFSPMLYTSIWFKSVRNWVDISDKQVQKIIERWGAISVLCLFGIDNFGNFWNYYVNNGAVDMLDIISLLVILIFVVYGLNLRNLLKSYMVELKGSDENSLAGDP